jgi:hypothetical protein
MLTQIHDQETKAVFADTLTLGRRFREKVAQIRKMYTTDQARKRLARLLRARFWIRHVCAGDVDPLAEALLKIAFRRTNWRLIAQALLEE